MRLPARNAYDQPIGPTLDGWQPPPTPARELLAGRYCTLHPLEPAVADALHDAFAAEPDDRAWTYLPYGPFESRGAFRAWVEEWSRSADHVLFSLHPEPDGRPAGVAGYLRIMPASGSIEIGHIHYAPALARTRAATEAMYLMMRHAFELGYRRCEWKCDRLNEPSRRAARRLGFTFEGTFRQATVYKGRSRDTDWFAIVDHEWPGRRAALEAWLDPANFDAAGRQRRPLAAFGHQSTSGDRE